MNAATLQTLALCFLSMIGIALFAWRKSTAESVRLAPAE